MKSRRKKYRSVASWKVFPAVGMVLLLLLLTSMNFFTYSGNKETVKTCMNNSGGDEESPESSNPCSSPAGPDEKSPNKPISINEEYIHEGAEVEHPFWVNPLFEHKIHEAEKLQIVHTECVTPPPKA